MAKLQLLGRLKTAFRKKKKTDNVCDNVCEPQAIRKPEAVKDAAAMREATDKAAEGIYIEYLFEAAHAAQVLSVRHSLRLDVEPDFHRRIRDSAGVFAARVAELAEIIADAPAAPELASEPPAAELADLPSSENNPVVEISKEETQMIEYASAIDELSMPEMIHCIEELSAIEEFHTSLTVPAIEIAFTGAIASDEIQLIEHLPTNETQINKLPTIDEIQTVKLPVIDETPRSHLPIVEISSSQPAALLPSTPLPDAPIDAAAHTKHTLTINDFALAHDYHSGAWGRVSCGWHRATGRAVVVKIAHKGVRSSSHVRYEQATMRALDGTHGMLELLASFHDKRSFYVVTPLCDQGDLTDFLHKYRPLDDDMFYYWAAQLLSGIGKIHAHGIVHRDIKPANIYISGGKLVIGDFGLAQFATDGVVRGQDLCGSLSYLAPEVYEDHDYSYASDIWAYAITLFEMAVGRVPLNSADFCDLDAYTNILFSATLDEWLSGDEIPAQLHSLLNSVFRTSKARRPSAAQLKYHRFFIDTNWTEMDAGQVGNPYGNAFRDWEPETFGPEDVPREADDDYMHLTHDSYPDFTFISPLLAPTAPASPANEEHYFCATPALVADNMPSPYTDCEPSLATPAIEYATWGATATCAPADSSIRFDTCPSGATQPVLPAHTPSTKPLVPKTPAAQPAAPLLPASSTSSLSLASAASWRRIAVSDSWAADAVFAPVPDPQTLHDAPCALSACPGDGTAAWLRSMRVSSRSSSSSSLVSDGRAGQPDSLASPCPLSRGAGAPRHGVLPLVYAPPQCAPPVESRTRCRGAKKPPRRKAAPKA